MPRQSACALFTASRKIFALVHEEAAARLLRYAGSRALIDDAHTSIFLADMLLGFVRF